MPGVPLPTFRRVHMAGLFPASALELMFKNSSALKLFVPSVPAAPPVVTHVKTCTRGGHPPGYWKQQGRAGGRGASNGKVRRREEAPRIPVTSPGCPDHSCPPGSSSDRPPAGGLLRPPRHLAPGPRSRPRVMVTPPCRQRKGPSAQPAGGLHRPLIAEGADCPPPWKNQLHPAQARRGEDLSAHTSLPRASHTA